MIKKRDMMVATLTLAFLALCLLLAAFLKDSAGELQFVPPAEDHEETLPADTPTADTSMQQDTAGAAAKNIFSAARGVPPQPAVPPEPETPPEQQQKPAGKPAEEVQLNMLGSYPNDWPRYKLTGVSCVNGRYTAIIRGGPVHKVTSGEVFARNYAIGDDLSGGVTLHEVRIDERLALLRRGNDVLTIKLGVEPPEVKK